MCLLPQLVDDVNVDDRRAMARRKRRSSSAASSDVTLSRRSRTTMSAERGCSSIGRRRMASNPATRQSSPARSSRLRVRIRCRGASSPAPTPLLPRSRRSPIRRRRSRPTGTCRHHSLSTNSPQHGKANMRATVFRAPAVSASKLADTASMEATDARFRHARPASAGAILAPLSRRSPDEAK